MRKKSPISIARVEICDYDRDDDPELINCFPYDGRRDFLVDRFIGGIAIKLEICNDRFDKGVRRNISVALVDMSTLCEVARQQLKVRLSADDFDDYFLHFPAEASGIVSGHTYRIVVRDDSFSETIAERIVRLFDKSTVQDPDEWYFVFSGGVRPVCENCIYKSLNTIDERKYMVRFSFTAKMDGWMLSVLPELEIRIYYPDGKYVKSLFRQPVSPNIESTDEDSWFVEAPIETISDINGVFYAELLCMDYAIAGFVFDTMSGRDVEGKWSADELQPMDEYSLKAAKALINRRLPGRNNPGDTSGVVDDDDVCSFDLFGNLCDFGLSPEEAPSENGAAGDEASDAGDEDSQESQMDSLDCLTGLRSVKEKLAIYESVVLFNKMRADKDMPVSTTPLHAMFLGSPGTGKTTVAKMIGRMLHRAGVLSKGHVVVRDRAMLLGQNYHAESENTRKAIVEAQGGILFIDEAYQLYQSHDPRDPGKFVIETLLTVLSDDSLNDWMLILAGYPEEMKRMFDMNPGFKSRIPDSNIYTFDDFTEAELMEIAENYLERNCFTLSPEARSAFSERLKADYARREKSFGNARHVVNMIKTEILPAMAFRVVKEGLSDEGALTEIQAADIPPSVAKPVAARTRVGFNYE